MRSVLARRFVRWTIRIAAILAIIFVALIIAAIALERRIGELVIRRGLEAINMRLRVPVSPQGVEFTFFANFPQASIHLRDVYIPGAWPSGERGTDTLLVAQSVFLVLNPIDLLLGEYRIEQFKVVRGVLNLRKNAQGQTNYNLLSDRQPEEQPAKEASLQLHNVRLQQMLVDFKDDTKQLYARGTVESLVAKGRFAKGASNLSLRAEGLVDYLKQGSFLYAQRQGFSLKAQIAQQGDLIAILESKLAIDRNRFSLMGSVNYATGDTDISAQGESIDLRAALAFASQFHIQLPPTLAVDGRLNASLELKGTMGTGKKILILMAISGKDLTLNYEGKKYRLVRFRGEFNNGKAASPTTTTLQLAECELQHGRSHASITLKLSNLNHPSIYAKLQASLHDSEFLPQALTPYLLGYKDLHANAELVTTLSRLDSLGPQQMENPRLHMDATFDNMDLQPTDSLSLRGLTGALTIIEDDLVKGAITGQVNGARVAIGVNAKRFMSSLARKSKAQWTIDANVSGARIRELVRAIAMVGVGAKAERAQDTSLTQKKRFDVWAICQGATGSIRLNDCKYCGLTIEHLEGDFNVLPTEAKIQVGDATLLGGRAHGTARLKYSTSPQQLLSADFYPEGVELGGLFEAFNSFGQKRVTHQNISGHLSGNVSLTAPLVRWRFVPNEISARANLTVRNGALRDVEAFDRLATFISLQELRDIQFSTLTNNGLQLQNGTFYIPEMRIRSTAIDLTLSGQHSLNSSYQYKVALGLSDLLFNRLKSRRREVEDQIYTEPANSNWATLYLILEGDSANSRVVYDRVALQARIADRVRAEKNELQMLLNEDFGDSAKRSGQTPRFDVHWDEDSTRTEPAKPAQTERPKTAPKGKKGKKKKAPAVTWGDD